MGYPDFSSGEVLTSADMDRIGLWRINQFSTTGATSLTCDNVFTTDFRNYRIMVNAGGVSALNYLLLTWINSSGTDVLVNYYSAALGWDYATAGSTAAHVSNRTDSAVLGALPNTTAGDTQIRLGVSLDVYDPRTATVSTLANGNYVGIYSGAYFSGGIVNSYNTPATAMRGFKLKSSAGTNIAAQVIVYGYNSL